MDKFTDIANLARLLLTFAPDSARNYQRELEGLKLCRQHDDMAQFTDASLHGMRCFRKNCEQARDQMNELVLLCRESLPELSLEWVRLNPPWRYDDADLDWTPIVTELRLIEDEALTKRALPSAAAEYLTYDDIAAKGGGGFTKRMVQDRKARLGPPNRGDGTRSGLSGAGRIGASTTAASDVVEQVWRAVELQVRQADRPDATAMVTFAKATASAHGIEHFLRLARSEPGPRRHVAERGKRHHRPAHRQAAGSQQGGLHEARPGRSL